ncbi:hypothetical protein CMK14_14625 [Candidatus Poribacteria bacterium]|nr:hypothetical protein [Candidatus Poribacteria bacterium]
MAYLIGLDGGGTKTIGLIADRAGNCLGRVTGSTTNYHLVGLGQTESTLKSIVTDLLNLVNLQIADCQSACFGLAGVGDPTITSKFYIFAVKSVCQFDLY